jgi:hypothetical protein
MVEGKKSGEEREKRLREKKEGVERDAAINRSSFVFFSKIDGFDVASFIARFRPEERILRFSSFWGTDRNDVPFA